MNYDQMEYVRSKNEDVQWQGDQYWDLMGIVFESMKEIERTIEDFGSDMGEIARNNLIYVKSRLSDCYSQHDWNRRKG